MTEINHQITSTLSKHINIYNIYFEKITSLKLKFTIPTIFSWIFISLQLHFNGYFFICLNLKENKQSVRSKLSTDLHISIIRNTECLQIYIGFFSPLFFQEGTQITNHTHTKKTNVLL